MLVPLAVSEELKQTDTQTDTQTELRFIQGVHKVRVHFKRFITLFVFAIEIICKKCYKVSST